MKDAELRLDSIKIFNEVLSGTTGFPCNNVTFSISVLLRDNVPKRKPKTVRAKSHFALRMSGLDRRD